jgi:dTDP-4-amino-4,6-dideoxygalactose transaminase
VGELGTHVYHLFPIRCKQRDKLQKYLAKKGIETLIHYPIPPHKQLCYKEYQHLTLPITELISNEELSLPISQVLTISDAENVVTALNEFS